MRRTIIPILLIAFSYTLWAQNQAKKILVFSSDSTFLEELKTVSPLARIVPVTAESAPRKLPMPTPSSATSHPPSCELVRSCSGCRS